MAAWNQRLPTIRRKGRHQPSAQIPDLPNIFKAYNLARRQPSPRTLILLRHSIGITSILKYWNVNQFPIDYAFQPRLRGRLTRRGIALRRNPWAYGVPEFHRHYRYSCLHPHFLPVHCSLRYSFNLARTLLYHQRSQRLHWSAASVLDLVP